MRCPEHPEDHFFRIEVTQRQSDEASPDVATDEAMLYCAYCGQAADLWDFAPEQRARMTAATAEQYAANVLDEMLGKAFGRQSRASSRKSGLSIEFKARAAPKAPTVAGTRRSRGDAADHAVQGCGEIAAVYNLAIYCPNCGQLAPRQRFGELIRVHRDGLRALPAARYPPQSGRERRPRRHL